MQKVKYYHVTYNYGGKLYYNLSKMDIYKLSKTGMVIKGNPFPGNPPEQMIIKDGKIILGTLEDLDKVNKNRTELEKTRCNIIVKKKRDCDKECIDEKLKKINKKLNNIYFFIFSLLFILFLDYFWRLYE